MKVKSLKHNFFMYFMRMFTSGGFTLFIFPYIARRIGVEGLGKIQYTETIVAYFILFINLGIFDYGKREVALYRNNLIKLNNLVNDLLTISYVTTILGSILYLLFIFFFITDGVYRNLLYLYFFNIFFNVFNVEWFYIGIENQEYITKRNIVIKLFLTILIFIYVKSEKDLYIYTIISILSITGSNIFNFIYLKKYIKLKIRKFSNVKIHLKRLFYLFFSVVALSISYNLDSIMIKNISGDIELGFYSLAVKFGKLPLIFGGVIAGILSPRLSNLLGENKKDEYLKLWNTGINVIFLLYIPISIGMFILSKSLVYIFGGVDFYSAIPIFKVFSFYLIAMGFAISTGVALDTNRKDKEYSLSLILGSTLNFIFNIFFIKKLGAFGAALATVITESVAVIIRIYLCKNIFKEIKLFNKNLLKIMLSSMIMGIVVFYLEKYIQNIFYKILISIIMGSSIYSVCLIILHENIMIHMLYKVLKRRGKK